MLSEHQTGTTWAKERGEPKATGITGEWPEPKTRPKRSPSQGTSCFSCFLKVQRMDPTTTELRGVFLSFEIPVHLSALNNCCSTYQPFITGFWEPHPSCCSCPEPHRQIHIFLETYCPKPDAALQLMPYYPIIRIWIHVFSSQRNICLLHSNKVSLMHIQFMIHDPVTQVLLGTAWYLATYCRSVPEHFSIPAFFTRPHWIAFYKILKKGNNQTHHTPNPNMPHGFLDLFFKILAPPSSFMSPESSTSFYSNNSITSENTKKQNRTFYSR